MPDGSVILVEIERRTLSRVTPDGKIQVIAALGGGPNGAEEYPTELRVENREPERLGCRNGEPQRERVLQAAEGVGERCDPDRGAGEDENLPDSANPRVVEPRKW